MLKAAAVVVVPEPTWETMGIQWKFQRGKTSLPSLEEEETDVFDGLASLLWILWKRDIRIVDRQTPSVLLLHACGVAVGVYNLTVFGWLFCGLQ
jgi:hypothetical protein